MKEDWKEYIAFSRKERRGVIVLLTLLIIVIAVPPFFPERGTGVNEDARLAWQERVAEWKRMGKEKPGYIKEKGASGNDGARNRFSEEQADTRFEGMRSPIADNGNVLSVPASGLFPFDPNTLTTKGWQQLGIPDKVIRTILHYISKGGQFRKPEDIEKIYGMRPVDAKRLLPFVKIEAIGTNRPGWITRHQPGKLRPDSTNAVVNNTSLPFPAVRKKRYTNLDVNTADTAAWSGFPGIGSKLALRIVNYREKLGGFHSPDQVGETWALPDSTFQKIKPWLQCPAPSLRKIRINEATVEELKQHPYLRWNLANAIVQYRQQHGTFRSAADLQGIILLTPLLITKIAPYIEY
ncbi:MAG: helix-hairpin-helix domain-containing protein [Pseudobacter sp.]|uniref:helix-hairpin-helix domain-containing protein n=1 Tax=Pseudobacter sp. TaxID=2045420 RepID=UPI003F81219B